jgi:hypothetical protein
MALGGCYPQAGVAIRSGPVGEVPADVEAYPRAIYDEHEVFFVHNRWYFRDGDTWSYYADEPQALAEWRKSVRGPERVLAAPAKGEP